MKRKQKLMIRWSIVTGGLVALFLATLHLIAGLTVVLGGKLVFELSAKLSAGLVILVVVINAILVFGLVTTILGGVALGTKLAFELTLLVAILIIVLIALFKLLVNYQFQTKVRNWLLAK